MPRPQDPRPPLPYATEEVRLLNAAARVQLSGTLTRPAGKQRTPALLLVNGSGAHDRDESLCDHRPFLVLADHLTRSGFTVLRLDDRGTGESTGRKEDCTHAELLDDLKVALDFLAAHPAVDPGRVGLIGHSDGASVAAAAAQRFPGIGLVVFMAGATGTGRQGVHEQSALIGRAAGATEQQIAHERRMNDEAFDILEGPLDDDAARVAVRPVVSRFLHGWPGGPPLPPTEIESHIDAMVDILVVRELRFALGCDFSAYLRDLPCPLLALYGARDLQVPPALNLPRLRSALSPCRAGAVIVELPGLNHLFQTAPTGAPSEYEEIEETIAPAVLRRITAFIRSTWR